MFNSRQRGASHAKDPSRRTLLKSGAGLVAMGAAAAQALPQRALAQGVDAELARLQQQRRILIRGGIVLTLDRAVGDFARADVLVEDGKIREVRPDIAATDAAVIDATGTTHLISGLTRTPSARWQA